MRFWLILIYVYTILTAIASTSTRKHHSHTQTITRASSEVGSMSDDEGQHRRRTKWTDKMCIDLQLCKRKALDLQNSDDCPKKPNGRKEGVMNITLRFWNDLGYEYLGKTAQNLRDKLGHLEKITKARSTQIRQKLRFNKNNKEKLFLVLEITIKLQIPMTSIITNETHRRQSRLLPYYKRE